jgi:hypothetical protein
VASASGDDCASCGGGQYRGRRDSSEIIRRQLKHIDCAQVYKMVEPRIEEQHSRQGRREVGPQARCSVQATLNRQLGMIESAISLKCTAGTARLARHWTCRKRLHAEDRHKSEHGKSYDAARAAAFASATRFADRFIYQFMLGHQVSNEQRDAILWQIVEQYERDIPRSKDWTEDQIQQFIEQHESESDDFVRLSDSLGALRANTAEPAYLFGVAMGLPVARAALRRKASAMSAALIAIDGNGARQNGDDVVPTPRTKNSWTR